MTFQPGVSGNPKGMVKGTRQNKALARDALFKKFAENEEQFNKELDDFIADKGMLAFYERFLRLFQPREINIETTKSEFVCLELLDGSRRYFGAKDDIQSAQIPAPSSN